MRERSIRVIATPRKEPDLDVFVSALLTLATEWLRAEREETAGKARSADVE